MTDNFDKYVVRWFHDYILDHEEDEDLMLSLFNTIVGRQEDDTLDEWLDEDETVCDYLWKCSADEIYPNFMYWPTDEIFDDMPDTEGFLTEMLKEAVSEDGLGKYSFCDEFIESIAEHLTTYQTPLSFFQDLQNGGCQSGMISELSYNSDCLACSGRECNDMEEFRGDLEDEIGSPIHSERNIPRYVWLCWLCYEEFAFRIGRYLFENDF